MCSFHDLKIRYKYYSDRVSPIGAGTVNNDRVTMCKYCSENGFPNEPITFTRRNAKWQPINYFDGNSHQHRYKEVEAK